jgi:hypothetical protein
MILNDLMHKKCSDVLGMQDAHVSRMAMLNYLYINLSLYHLYLYLYYDTPIVIFFVAFKLEKSLFWL